MTFFGPKSDTPKYGLNPRYPGLTPDHVIWISGSEGPDMAAAVRYMYLVVGRLWAIRAIIGLCDALVTPG